MLLCDNSKACVEAVEAGKADVAAGTWAGLEYYIYETGSTLVTSLLPGQNMDADIAVSRDCDTQLLAAMNNYIYSISEDELAGYLSTGNLHPDSSSVLLFARRYPVQAMMAVTAVTALVAAIVVCLLLRPPGSGRRCRPSTTASSARPFRSPGTPTRPRPPSCPT